MELEAGLEGGDVSFDVFDLLDTGTTGVQVGETLAAASELGFEDSALVISAGHDLNGRKAR